MDILPSDTEAHLQDWCLVRIDSFINGTKCGFYDLNPYAGSRIGGTAEIIRKRRDGGGGVRVGSWVTNKGTSLPISPCCQGQSTSQQPISVTSVVLAPDRVLWTWLTAWCHFTTSVQSVRYIARHINASRHRGNTLFCHAVTSILSQWLLHKMTKGQFW